MSTIGDALIALRNVVLIQERIEVMQRQLDRMAADVKDVNDYAASIDKRMVRIETMIEMSERGGVQPRLEG